MKLMTYSLKYRTLGSPEMLDSHKSQSGPGSDHLCVFNAEEHYIIPTVGFTGTRRGVFLNRNNMLNQPKTHVRDHNGFGTFTYYFIGGKDNYHHPDNRSGLASYSFLGGS